MYLIIVRWITVNCESNIVGCCYSESEAKKWIEREEKGMVNNGMGQTIIKKIPILEADR